MTDLAVKDRNRRRCGNLGVPRLHDFDGRRHGRQRLPQFVRQRADEGVLPPVQRAQGFFGVPEALLVFAHRLLTAAPLADVLRDDDDVIDGVASAAMGAAAM